LGRHTRRLSECGREVARVQGYLVKQAYREGTIVKAGDVLFEIDPRPFAAALAQAKAELATAQAQQVKAQLDEGRQVKLFASKAASEQDRDAAVQNNAAMKATVEAAKAAVEQAQLNLEFTKITAHVDGLAGIAKPGIGDLVGPGTGELTTISTIDPIKAVFQVSEQEYLSVAKDLNEAMAAGRAFQATLELVLADGSVYPEKGRFSKADRQVDTKTGTLRVEALFANPGNILRPGIFTRLRAIVEVKKGALLVPQRAVSELQGSYSVVVVGGEGKAEIRPVKVGERIGSLWVVEKGLKPGERVIVEGIQKVREGAPVVAKPWTAPAPAKPIGEPDADPTDSEAK
jgi:membrane fusion protein, multidrug efflux system